MRRFAILVALGACVACGNNDKPPLTPDSEHPMLADDAGPPGATSATPATTAPPTTPAK